MINYRVENSESLVKDLVKNGVTITDKYDKIVGGRTK